MKTGLENEAALVLAEIDQVTELQVKRPRGRVQPRQTGALHEALARSICGACGNGSCASLGCGSRHDIRHGDQRHKPASRRLAWKSF